MGKIILYRLREGEARGESQVTATRKNVNIRRHWLDGFLSLASNNFPIDDRADFALKYKSPVNIASKQRSRQMSERKKRWNSAAIGK